MLMLGAHEGAYASAALFVALRRKLIDKEVMAKTAYIERASPWENGHIESFNARLRDELLDGEIFYSLREARIVIESWRRHYNTISRTPHLDTSHQHRRCSCLHLPRGRLRYADRLRYLGR
jgi:transposase InsO family protein